MANVPAVSELGIEGWLSKAVEWMDTNALETQQDICLHLPKLQEFLLQIYESLKHMNTKTAIETFPAIGQFLGRLCWNPVVIGHDDSRKLLMFCMCCLYSSEPQSVIENKANSWIKNLVCHLFSSPGQEEVRDTEMIPHLGFSSPDFQDKLLKNIISSIVLQFRRNLFNEDDKQFFADYVHKVSITCISIVTLPEVAPLLEEMLAYHGPGPNEILDDFFLETVNDAVLRKKITLSESAVLSLWLRHLPCLEKAVLDLFQRLIVLQSKSVKEMEQIIKDSFLAKAALHSSIFRVVDDIFRNALIKSDGNMKVHSIIRLFTHSFLKEYDKENVEPKLPLKMYFFQESPALLLALLRKSEGLTPNICVEHLLTVVKILRDLTEKGTPGNVFESWFLLIHFGEWVDIAAEQLLTSDPEISDDLLWLLAFYYNPCNENQSTTRTMVEAKLAYEHLLSVFRHPTVCVTFLQQAFQVENKTNEWHPCTLQLVRHLCVSFLLISPAWHDVIGDCICNMTQTQEAASEVTDVLARTLCRLDIPGMESQKIITIAQRLLHDS